MKKVSLHFLLLPCIVLSLAVFAPETAFAGNVKNIERVRPRIAQRGTTVEVEIFGVSLQNPREMIFFQPGIRAFDFRYEEVPREGFAHGGFIDCKVVCKFEISADCLPGEYPFRLLTATELTHVGTFHVSPFPTIDEGDAANDTREQATKVSPNVTIRAWMGNDPIDYYRVPVKAGEQLSVELDSVTVTDQHYGGSEFDLAVRILDETGKELAANDDNPLHLQDPVVSTVMKQDGFAFVEAKRSVFAERKTPYVLHIGTNRRPLVAFPPGAQAGTTQKFQLLGDALGDFEQELQVPAERGTFDYFGDAPSAVKLRSSPFPNVLEDSQAAVTPVSLLPAAINGILETGTDTDTFQLSVNKGEPLRVRVYASALASPIDAYIKLRPLDENGTPGEVELEADDAKLTERDVFGTSYRAGGGRKDVLDPSVIWTPKQDGNYLLEISDSSNSGGPLGIYRIEIETPPTLVQTYLQSATFDWTESTRVTGMAVAQGNRWTLSVGLPEGQWTRYEKPFALTAQGLPPGVKLVSPPVMPHTPFWPIQLMAEPNANLAGAVITLQAKPVDSEKKIETRSQHNVPFINHPGGDAFHAVKMDRYIMGVTDPAPFTVEIQQPKAPIVRGGELTVPVKITRHNGFEGPVEFSAGIWGAGRSIQASPATVIPADESTGELQLLANPDAPLATIPFVVYGQSVSEEIDPFLGAGHIRVSSQFANLTIIEPYVELTAQPESVRRGEQKKFVWNVQHKSPFEGQARVLLKGLPKGVTTDSTPMLSADTKEIVFEVAATDEALVGQATGISCEVLVTVAGQEITQRTGQGTLRIDPALTAGDSSDAGTE